VSRAGHGCLLQGRAITSTSTDRTVACANAAPAAEPLSRRRSPSKQVLPKRKGLPQNRCYQSPHRKGGPVTERGRREYAAVIRARYGQADKRERGRLLTEYCRTTGCHRKAAIRRLRPLRRRRPRQPRRLATALAPLRARVPLRTWSEWTGVRPGAVQGDLVLHCGESLRGRYCATLVAVDVATSWTELQALYDLHHQRV